MSQRSLSRNLRCKLINCSIIKTFLFTFPTKDFIRMLAKPILLFLYKSTVFWIKKYLPCVFSVPLTTIVPNFIIISWVVKISGRPYRHYFIYTKFLECPVKAWISNIWILKTERVQSWCSDTSQGIDRTLLSVTNTKTCIMFHTFINQYITTIITWCIFH